VSVGFAQAGALAFPAPSRRKARASRLRRAPTPARRRRSASDAARRSRKAASRLRAGTREAAQPPSSLFFVLREIYKWAVPRGSTTNPARLDHEGHALGPRTHAAPPRRPRGWTTRPRGSTTKARRASTRFDHEGECDAGHEKAALRPLGRGSAWHPQRAGARSYSSTHSLCSAMATSCLSIPSRYSAMRSASRAAAKMARGSFRVPETQLRR
jgi:hypothetical protein